MLINAGGDVCIRVRTESQDGLGLRAANVRFDTVERMVKRNNRNDNDNANERASDGLGY